MQVYHAPPEFLQLMDSCISDPSKEQNPETLDKIRESTRFIFSNFESLVHLVSILLERNCQREDHYYRLALVFFKKMSSSRIHQHQNMDSVSDELLSGVTDLLYSLLMINPFKQVHNLFHILLKEISIRRSMQNKLNELIPKLLTDSCQLCQKGDDFSVYISFLLFFLAFPFVQNKLLWCDGSYLNVISQADFISNKRLNRFYTLFYTFIDIHLI